MCPLLSTPYKAIDGHVRATTDIPCVRRDVDLTMKSVIDSHILSGCSSTPLYSIRFEIAISGSGKIFPSMKDLIDTVYFLSIGG